MKVRTESIKIAFTAKDANLSSEREEQNMKRAVRVASAVVLLLVFWVMSVTAAAPQLEATGMARTGLGIVAPRTIGQSFILDSGKINGIEFCIINSKGLSSGDDDAWGEDGGLIFSIYEAKFSKTMTGDLKFSTEGLEPIVTALCPTSVLRNAWNNAVADDSVHTGKHAWIAVPIEATVKPGVEYIVLIEPSDKNANPGSAIVEFGLAHDMELTYSDFKAVAKMEDWGYQWRVQTHWQFAFKIF